MTKKWLLLAPVVGAVGVGIGAGVGTDKLLGAPEGAKQDVKPAVELPLTRVVLRLPPIGPTWKRPRATSAWRGPRTSRLPAVPCGGVPTGTSRRCN